MAFTPLQKGNPPLFDELYKRAGSKPPVGINTASGLWMLTRVIQAANSLDPAVVKAKWESMDTIDTLCGKGYVGGDETYGIKRHSGPPYALSGDGQWEARDRLDRLRQAAVNICFEETRASPNERGDARQSVRLSILRFG